MNQTFQVPTFSTNPTAADCSRQQWASKLNHKSRSHQRNLYKNLHGRTLSAPDGLSAWPTDSYAFLSGSYHQEVSEALTGRMDSWAYDNT